MMPSDKPDDGTIDNDAELDRWYESFVREAARKSKGKGDPRYTLGAEPVIPTYQEVK